jgi:pimeloyl-ACP methyl ester carboxylesterase
VNRLLLLFLFTTGIAFAQKPGTLTESVTCLNSTSQTYALYVPASYTSSTPTGVILLFDPGARGKLPVSLYQKLAEEHHLILACSNNSHNGPIEPSIASGHAVLEDVLARFNIDRSFIVVSGFSGGGRTAVEMALRRGTVAGVITCGAALPSQNTITKSKQLAFAEVIGQLDMNYQESVIADSYLKSIGNPSFFVHFYGGHQWPPIDAYEEAIQWHELRKKKLNASEFFSGQMKKVKMQADSGYLYEANRMLSQLIPDFSESKEVFTLDSQLASIQKDKRFKSESSEVRKVNSNEIALQKDFQAHYMQHLANGAPDSAFHAEYWKGYRRQCDRMIKSSSRNQKLSGLRLIDFGWRLCAEQQYFFEEIKQYRQVAMLKKIREILSTSGVKAR